MNNFKDKKILITGASKGLGLEIANAFEKDGAQLILIARSKELLDKLVNNFNDKKKTFSLRKRFIGRKKLRRCIK